MIKFILQINTCQIGQIYTVELCQSITGQNGQMLVKFDKCILQICTGQVLVKMVKFWPKCLKLYCRGVLVMYWSKMQKSGQNSQTSIGKVVDEKVEMVKFILLSYTGQNCQSYNVDLCQSSSGQDDQILV